MKILFVCSGNICRSPTAEGLFRKRLAEQGVDITCDSAGTNGYHIGDPPDHRAIVVALENGFDISDQRARRIEVEDFDNYDVIYAMDSGHLSALHSIRPETCRAKVIPYIEGRDVPDPWYGEQENFYQTYEIIEAEVDRIITELKELL